MSNIDLDFSKWKAHPHYLGELMTPAKGKSNLQLYNDEQEFYGKSFQKYSDMKDKMSETGQKLLKSIKASSDKIDVLEPIKHHPHLSVGCKTRLRRIWQATVTGRKHRVESKYLQKGLFVEEDVITLYSMKTGIFHKKNKVRVENDFLDGEWDFTTEDDTVIVDAKGSWDLNTFYDSYFAKLDSGYNWQLQGYMCLGNKEKARLVYGLINTPQHLLDSELRKVMYQMFGSEQNMQLAPPESLLAYQDECDYIRSMHIFDDLPMDRRIKILEVPRKEEMISQIEPKVQQCRWYLNNIENLNENETDD